MTHCLVWFNGPTSLDLHNKIPPQPQEIGCNYILQHRAVNHVVAMDRALRPSITIQPNVQYYGCNGHKQLPHWQEVLYTTLDQPQNSGLLAVRLAMNLKFKPIYVLGCDWGANDQSIFDAKYGNQRRISKMTNPGRKLLERWGREHDIVLVGSNPALIRIQNISVPDLLTRLNNAK